MGYTHGRKYTTKRKRGLGSTSKAAIMYKRPTAAVQRAQIATLAKEVAANKRKIASTRYKVTHQIAYNQEAIPGNTFAAYALIQPSAWRLVFSGDEEAKGSKYTPSGMYYDLLVENRGTRRFDCTIYFASPKNQKVVVECGGANTTTCSALLEGRDYVNINGCAVMNDKRWNIHKKHELASLPIVTGVAGAISTTQYDNDTQKNRRRSWLKNPLKVNNRVDTETWKDIADNEVTANQRMHMYVFHTSTGVLPAQVPTLSLNCLFNAYTSE